MTEFHISSKELETPLDAMHVINKLYAYMAWPDDKIERHKLIQISEVRKYAALLDQAAERSEEISAQETRRLFQIAWDCPNERVENKKTQERIDQGLILSAQLKEAFGVLRTTGTRAPFWSKEKDNGIFESLLGRRQKKGLSKKNIERIWGRIRPVAHLFMARSHLSDLNPNLQMPCDLDRLINFISLAEEYRQIGEENKPYRSREAYIPHDCSLKIIASGFDIPSCAIDWHAKEHPAT